MLDTALWGVVARLTDSSDNKISFQELHLDITSLLQGVDVAAVTEDHLPSLQSLQNPLENWNHLSGLESWLPNKNERVKILEEKLSFPPHLNRETSKRMNMLQY